MFFRINPINATRITVSISVMAVLLSLTACSRKQEAATPNQEIAKKKLSFPEKVTLIGAGSTTPAPIYQRWFQEIGQKYPNLQIDYQSDGSGAGIRQFVSGTVDFAASDAAMTDEEIQWVNRDVLMLPMTAGAIALAYKTLRQAYTDIMLGKIAKWNDPVIAAANPGVQLPSQNIKVIYRSDSSGTTAAFTKHLSAISPEWKEKVGEGKAVKWFGGIAGRGDAGVAALIKQTRGSIGYVGYSHTMLNKLNVAALENKSGNYIMPSPESAAKSIEAITLPENLRAFIADPQGKESYPIVTYSWLLAYKEYPDASKANAMEGAIEYGLTSGQKYAAELGYVPLPQNVREKVAKVADVISKDYNITVGGTAGRASVQ